jgi:hypothetical protein
MAAKTVNGRKPATAGRTRRASAAAPTLTFAAPAAPPKAEVSEVKAAEPPVRMVNGQAVVADEPESSHLSKVWGKPIAMRGRRILTLTDGSKVSGCADCDATGSVGDIIKHRVAEHGATRPGQRGSGRKAETEGPDLAFLGMTLGEVLELGQHVGRLEADLDQARDERDAATAARVEAVRELTSIRRALAKVGFELKAEGGE